MILIDTNVFSEVTKPRPDDRVVEWLFERRNDTLLSTIVVAELTVGIRTTRRRTHRTMLLGWLRRLIDRHAGRVVDFGLGAAAKWGEFGSAVLIREESVGSRQFDSLIAAQALDHGVPLATRNWRHFDGIGLEVINPWQH
jgi:predicted nucleic acid-binding protein